MKFGLTPKQRKAILGVRMAGTALRILEFVDKCDTDGATCDECVRKLVIQNNSVSTRMNELVAAGCLVKADFRRRTSSGRKAAVFLVGKDARFFNYLALPRRISSGRTKLSAEDMTALGAARTFIAAWRKARSSPRREEAVVKLVRALRAVANRP